MKKLTLIASALALLGSSTSQARHVDIVPYHEVNPQGERTLNVGSYDLTGPSDGSQSIQRNVLMFYGYASDDVPAAVPGSAVNANPGWNRPMDFHAFEEGDGLFGADYPDGTAPTGFAHLGFNVVADPRLGRNLSYWSGSGDVAFGSVPSGEIIDLYKFNPFGPPGEVVTLTGANADVPGLELTDSLSPGYHEHSVASVWGSATRASDDQPAPGFYLYTLELTLLDEVIQLPNGFVKFIPGEQTSPVFHVMLITPGLVDDSVYEYGDIIYEFQYDEFQ